MTENKKVVILRDVDATMVPSGQRVVLAKDEEANIVQKLGNNYTVNRSGNMFI
jgi:hypothetical protein